MISDHLPQSVTKNLYRWGFALLGLTILIWPLFLLFDWAFWNAVWIPSLKDCQALKGQAACWGVIAEKYRLLLWGTYPLTEQYRALIASLLLLIMLGFTVSYAGRIPWLHLALWWLLALIFSAGILKGGIFGLQQVATAKWGGLPLTLILSMGSTLLAWPLALCLALSRIARNNLIRHLARIYIEIIRGVPLIAVLFVAAFAWPLLYPETAGNDKLIRLLIAMALFIAAYLAEIIRGGLQIVPKHQWDSATALGMNRYLVQQQIILPQALKAVLPALVSSLIATIKDSSLVTIVSVFELTGSLSLALGGDPQWRAYYMEGYLFIGFLYATICYSIAWGGKRLEKRLHNN